MLFDRNFPMIPFFQCILVWILCVLSLFGLDQCQVLKPLSPDENYASVVSKPQISVINLFAEIKTLKLESLINQKVETILYQDTSFLDHDHDNLKLLASRDGAIKLSFDQDQLSWELPAHVIFQKRVKVFGYNLPMVDSWQYSGQIKLRYKTKLSLGQDWSIKTQTISDGFSWTKKPAVKIGSVDVPITLVANLLLPSYLQSFSFQIDTLFASNFNFRSSAEKGWAMLWSPFKIPGSYNAWLSIVPNSISVLPVKGSGGLIRVGAAITSEVDCIMDTPPNGSKISKLPDMVPLKAASDTFKINLLTDIPYPTINRELNTQLSDSVFVFGSRKLKFENFRVYGNYQRMVVETKVTGSINGLLYLTGVPYFNAEDTTLRIKDLKFDLKTHNLLLKSSKWLFNGKIERSITSSLAIPFRSNVLDVESQIKKLITHYPLAFGFELQGKLTKLRVSDLYLTPKSVKANIVFYGNLTFGISESKP
jgi:Domain of unknown function (DUF4403)